MLNYTCDKTKLIAMNLEKGPAGERDGREIKKKLGRESLKCTHMHTHTHDIVKE